MILKMRRVMDTYTTTRKLRFFLKLVLQNNRSTHWKHEFIQQKYCKTQCETHISKIRHGDKMLQGLSKRQKTDLENEQSDQGRCSGRDLVFALWRQLGWQSAQTYAEQMWNQSPKPTCKQATEGDLICLSPEAQALCRFVDVAESFADHSTITAAPMWA